MLSAVGLSKSYGGRPVVKGASITVDRGEVVGLLGPNGAGKTTTFQMLCGLIPCDGGAINLEGTDVTHLALDARARMGIGYLPQEASVFRDLSVAENVMCVLELRADLNASQRAAELAQLLEELQVAHIAQHRGRVLSGGQRRRVEIARALAADPMYVLLDEPFAGIDPIAVGDVQRVVSHLTTVRNIGILVTDHNVREALGMCDHAAILDQGTVLISGAPDVICEDATVREVYLGDDFRL